jgi:hypothetical protein
MVETAKTEKGKTFAKCFPPIKEEAKTSIVLVTRFTPLFSK